MAACTAQRALPAMQALPRCAAGQDAMQACTRAFAPGRNAARRHARRSLLCAAMLCQGAALGSARCKRMTCRAEQRDPQQAEAEDEAVPYSERPPQLSNRQYARARHRIYCLACWWWFHHDNPSTIIWPPQPSRLHLVVHACLLFVNFFPSETDVSLLCNA